MRLSLEILHFQLYSCEALLYREKLQGIEFLCRNGFVGSRLIINYFIWTFRALSEDSTIPSTWMVSSIDERCDDRTNERINIKQAKFSPVQKRRRRWVGTGDVAVIALGLSVRRLLLVIVHHVLFVIWSTVLLETGLRQAVLTVELIIVLQIKQRKEKLVKMFCW